MPTTLQLEINQTSGELAIYAKPDEVLHIRPKFDKNNLKFVPEKITIYPSYNEAKFQITVLQPGSFKIDFEVIGLHATVFEKPKQLTVYGYQKVNAQPVDVDTDFLDNNCNEIILKKCDRKIKLTSSCSWSKGTNGFVGVKYESQNIPISLVGLDKKTERILSATKFLNPSKELKQYLAKRNISMPCVTPCNNSNYHNDAIDFIAKSNIFQRAYLKNINSMLPSWIRIDIDPNERYFDTFNYLTFLGDSSYVRKMGKCGLIDISVNDMHSIYLPKSMLRFSVGSTLKSTIDIEQATCLAVNLCKNALYISLNEKNYLNYAQEIAEMGIKNIILKVKGFAFGVNESMCSTFDKKEECTVVNAYADILLSSSFNFKKTSFSFEGRLYTTLDGKVSLRYFLFLISNFSRTQSFGNSFGSKKYNLFQVIVCFLETSSCETWTIYMTDVNARLILKSRKKHFKIMQQSRIGFIRPSKAGLDIMSCRTIKDFLLNWEMLGKTQKWLRTQRNVQSSPQK